MKPTTHGLSPLLALALLLPRAAAQEPGELFDEVARVLQSAYYDEVFRQDALPGLVSTFRPAALAASDHDEERAVVHALLALVPASHLALYSRSTFRALMDDLSGREVPTLGMSLVQHGGRFFADRILEGGPAVRAGVLRGDRVLSVDGVPVGASPRLDWRADDAALPDPPIHALRAEAGEKVLLVLEREPGRQREVVVRCAELATLTASSRSIAVLEHRELRLGYVHLHYIYSGGVVALVRDSVQEAFRGCDGWVLDLRGRGGNALEAMALVNLLRRMRRDDVPPMVALVDDTTRSAKEVVAWLIQEERLGTLVGERTAGAVLPASFVRLGDEDVLMYPAQGLGRFSDALEGVGVTPDVEVSDRLPYAAGGDPILAAALELFPVPGGGRRPRE